MEGVGDFEEEEDGFGTESEVVLNFLDSLPKDFDITLGTLSNMKSSGRITIEQCRYNKKVFRVMMKSVDPDASSRMLNELLKKYKVTHRLTMLNLAKMFPEEFIIIFLYQEIIQRSFLLK